MLVLFKMPVILKQRCWLCCCCCSAGLDWLVHVAGLRGLKLLLVLTNGGSATWGGMKQYTDWVDPGLTVTDFYGNDTVKVRRTAAAQSAEHAAFCMLSVHTEALVTCRQRALLNGIHIRLAAA
jgi:hypothetical protein